MLVGNGIELQYSGKNIDDKALLKSELAKQVVYNQQPNKKFLNLFRLKVGIYAASYRKRQKLQTRQEMILKNDPDAKPISEKQKKKLANSFLGDFAGEAPVLFDSAAIEPSVQRMKNYLFYHGFFHNSVSASYQSKNKKTSVTYVVQTGVRYTFRSIILQPEDSSIAKIVSKNPKDTYLKAGDFFDVDMVRKERNRMADLVLNEGYYTFSPDFIYLKIDSTIGNQEIDAYLVVKNEVDSTLHKKYQFLEVNFQISYDDKIRNAALERSDYMNDTICDVNYKVLKNSVYPRILSRSLWIKPGDMYSKDSELKTLNNLNNLGVFKFVNIEHTPFSFSPDEMGLITSIRCSPVKRNTVGTEMEVNTNTSSNLGFFVNANYTNRNVFKSAAKLFVGLSSGVLFQVGRTKDELNKQSAVNSVNLNAEFKISLARLFPNLRKRKCESYDKYRPSTFIGSIYNFQKRIQYYTIHTVNVNYGYEWYNEKFRHIFSPLSMTFVKPTKITEAFQDSLNSNPRFARSFEQQFILGQDYTFTYTNQNLHVGKYKNYFFFRANFAMAGNILYGITSATQKGEPKPYTLSRIPFAQYVRFELEPKYFFNFKRGQTLGIRFFAGIGIPYGNSSYNNSAVLPYIKQFFAGGPNSLRGWVFRQIGPGGYNFHELGKNVIDQTGDLRFEWNAEYRFNIYKSFKGALFSDAGNIWLIKDDPTKELEEFNIKRFGREIAWDAGAGVRLDLSFFVVRFDVGFVLYDPGYEAGSRWISDIIELRKDTRDYYQGLGKSNKEIRKEKLLPQFTGLNIAIGYPF
jgi:outer membrane protein insertion porin family